MPSSKSVSILLQWAIAWAMSCLVRNVLEKAHVVKHNDKSYNAGKGKFEVIAVLISGERFRLTSRT